MVAYEELQEKCYERLNVYPNSWFDAASDQLSKELLIIKKQGSAERYLEIESVLSYVKAERDEYCFYGVNAFSIVSFLLGFTETDPIKMKFGRFSDFFFCPSEKQMPDFFMLVNDGLYDRLLDYYLHYDGLAQVSIKEYSALDHPEFYVKYVDVINPGDNDNPSPLNGFTIGFRRKDYKEHLKTVFVNPIYCDIFKAMKPGSFIDFIRCICLASGTGSWNNNGKRLIKKHNSPSKIITCREDVYSFLILSGIEKETAYHIAEEVRKGRINVNGWDKETLELFKQHDIPKWFIDSCKKIKFLPSISRIAESCIKALKNEINTLKREEVIEEFLFRKELLKRFQGIVNPPKKEYDCPF